MTSKVGVYVREDGVELVAVTPGVPLSVSDLGSFEFKVKNVYGELTLDDQKQLSLHSEVTRKTLESKKLTELDASIIIPDEKCSLQIIKLPLVSEKEILSAIELQSEEFVPYPIDKASFDYQILSVDKENNEMFLLLIVALKKVIDQVSDYVLSLGLYPIGIEPESTAFFRLIFNEYLNIKENIIMCVNIGENSTQISILNRTQQQLITTNNLSIGNNFFYKALENNLNIPRESAKEMFRAFAPTDENASKILTSVFTEFAKEINKILLSALDKLGTLPKQIYLYSHGNENTFVHLFAANSILQPYQVIPFQQLVVEPAKVRTDPKLTSKLNQFLVSLGAVV
jgi:Tfp pilus assembly PilM family ATPase